MANIKNFFPLGLLLLFFHSLTLLAAEADGSIKIRLYGSLAPDVGKRITVKQIESSGQLYTEKVYHPYEKRTERYTGIWLKDLVNKLAAPGTRSVTTKAIDDYEIDFSAEEWNNIRILVATQVNGKYIGFDQKGPMRIIFPDYDAKKEIYQVNLPKWMWMITKIEFKLTE